ncbi:DsbC family protein [Wenzhouxiangella marina]|uniref:Thiol:disulfide interchange protein n=1 Tax=Wenzhouxiangella marina TaxID=1579979 RepID=A0A0K0XTB6_9GAMM|nr:DsbC family protein [Wenzhouxiangella marina]AKS40861.1 Thiol:disulfide interchange protein DsbC [Wenzhouxiangella marina]MBB6087735.1 thiol:disulfide interchange protein DsbC [Wenzhouxiangella marina]
MKPFSLFQAVAGLALLGTGTLALATDAIEERLESLVPDMSQVVIAETPIDGMMQVQIGGDVVYMSEDGRFLMQGRLIDMETQIDLTDQAKSGLRKAQLADLDDADMVTFGEDDAQYEVLVFTDIDCGYCRRLHEQMAEYVDAGIQVNYLAFPRAGVGSDSYNKLVSVWCAEDRNAAMDIAKSGRTPPPATCENPVEAQYRMGQSLGVTGTPSILTRDGDIIPGYVPPEQLVARLEALAADNAGD